MRLKEQYPTSTTDLNNNCVKTDDHLPKQQVHLQLKRSSTENGLNNRTSLDSIELKELTSHVANHLRTSPLVSPSSPHSRQPSPSQLSIGNHHSHQKCNGVCVITSEPKASCKSSNSHRHLATSHSNGTVAPQKIQIQINGNAIFSPSVKSPSALNSPHSPLVPSSYLSNSSKYTGYSTYGKLTHGAEHLPNTSSLCIDNLHSKTKIYNFKVSNCSFQTGDSAVELRPEDSHRSSPQVVIVGDIASGKTSYIRKLTQPKNGSRSRYNYYNATVGFEFR